MNSFFWHSLRAPLRTSPFFGRKFAGLVFLISLVATPLLGSSCASSTQKTEAPPPATAQTIPAAQTQPTEMPVPAPAVVLHKKVAGARMVCELDNDKRTVVLRDKGKGCQVTYTKFGHSHVAGESPDGTDRCDNVFDRLKHNLSAAGYACRETD